MLNKASVIVVTILAGLLGLTFQLSALKAVPAGVSEGPATLDQPRSVKAAVRWMVAENQNDDGGYNPFGSGANQSPSTIPFTLDAVLAIAVAGYNPAAIFPGQESAPILFLRNHGSELTTFASANGGQAGKVVMALTAAAVDPRDFGGVDYLDILMDQLQPDGSYNVGDAFKQAIAIIGVASAGEPVPAASAAWLAAKQAADGSWDDGYGTTANPDTTAMVVMALLAAGRMPDDATIVAAVDFLALSQKAGGWSYAADFAPGVNSTAVVVQALSALGEDWYSASGPWVKDGNTPLQALLAFQSDHGSFVSDYGQGPKDDLYGTVQAIPAVAGRPFPLPARLEAAMRALECMDEMQDDTTGGWSSFAGGPVDAAGTSRAIQAIAALDGDPRSEEWTVSSGTDAVEALEALTPQYLASGRGGRVGIVMQGVVAAGPPATVGNFAGEDLPLLMSGYLSPTGEYDSTAFGIFAHAEAMLGLIAAEEPVDPSAIDFLLASHTDGNFGEADANGIALQVLGNLSLPTSSGTIASLLQSQTEDGGWGFGGVSNPSATSEVVQGLVTIDQNPFAPDWSVVSGGRLTNSADLVLAQQSPDGCWPNAYGPGQDPYSTTDAILLLVQQPGWGYSTVNLPFVVAEH